MRAPTAKQIQLLVHVDSFTATYGRPPTYRQLARVLGVELKTAAKRAHYAAKKDLLANLTLTDAGRALVDAARGGGVW